MPHDGSTILPKDVQVTPFCFKGPINPILNVRHSEVVDGFLGSHTDFDDGHPGLLDNVSRGILAVKMHLASFRPKEVDDETFEDVQRLPNVGEAISVVALNLRGVCLSFKN